MGKGTLDRFPFADLRSTDSLVVTCRSCGRERRFTRVECYELSWYGICVGDVEPKLRCSACQARGQVGVRLVR